jgi:hypothetical protein
MKRPAEKSVGCFRSDVLRHEIRHCRPGPAWRAIDDAPVLMKNK